MDDVEDNVGNGNDDMDKGGDNQGDDTMDRGGPPMVNQESDRYEEVSCCKVIINKGRNRAIQ